MKIIKVDNYDRGHIKPKIIVENIDEEFGNVMVQSLNDAEDEDAEFYYLLVKDDYKIEEFY